MKTIRIQSRWPFDVPSHLRVTSSSMSSLLAALLRHYEELVAHVRRGPVARWGDRGMAREVVHDVCAELIASPPAQPPRTPLAFLRTVCTRRAIDRCRQEARHAFWVDSVERLPEVPDPAGDPAHILLGRQRLALLADAIHALPPRQRDVFVMHRIHGVAQQDIARHLGISLKTVEKHLVLGTAACRRALDEALRELAVS
ncbi:RNA polymerase sigma factor [Ottowia sp.]|uniref:RNA polymerase sigma factor n=1 Tax=Ottowia sp. TaxID=1898956 RepID=UPI0039E3EB4F